MQQFRIAGRARANDTGPGLGTAFAHFSSFLWYDCIDISQGIVDFRRPAHPILTGLAGSGAVDKMPSSRPVAEKGGRGAGREDAVPVESSGGAELRQPIPANSGRFMSKRLIISALVSGTSANLNRASLQAKLLTDLPSVLKQFPAPLTVDGVVAEDDLLGAGGERLIISILVLSAGASPDQASLEDKLKEENGVFRRALEASHPGLKVENVIVEDDLFAASTNSAAEDDRLGSMDFDGSIPPG